MLYTHDVVYRPPPEQNSVLLEIATGCSYGKCDFCRYSTGEEPLCLISPELIQRNIYILSQAYPGSERMFLLGGNVLAFKTEFLCKLFQEIKLIFPSIRTISMYARAKDVLNKSVEQLMSLRELGMDTLYIGIESGSNRILKIHNKGISSGEMLAALMKLDKLGIPYGLSFIIGLGGKGSYHENATESSNFINKTYPQSIRLMTLTVFTGTVLERKIQLGDFVLQDEYESLLEEEILIKNLELDAVDTLFVANHVSNRVPLLGLLPRDKARILKELRTEIDSYNLSEGNGQNIAGENHW